MISNRTLSIPLALLVAALVLAALPPRPSGVRWREWDAGLAEAKSSGKPVLVDAYTDWCGWCKKLDREVYARPEVRDYLERHFVPIKLDAEASRPALYEGQRLTYRGIAQRFRITGYPTTVFLRSNGDHIVNVSGYRSAPDFRVLLRYIGEDHIGRGVPWADFSQHPEKYPER